MLRHLCLFLKTAWGITQVMTDVLVNIEEWRLRNIEEHLNELTVQFHRQRQEAISEELLDVVTGFEALTVGEKKE